MRLVVGKGLVCVLATLSAHAASAADYKEITVSDGGTISGRVTLSKPAPKLPPHKISKDGKICGAAVPNETWVVGADGGLANVVVRIEKIKKGKKLEAKDAVMDQVKCAYTPHVMTVAVGTKLVLKNSDPILHNSHSYMGNRTLFNLALPNDKVEIPKKMSKPGMVKFTCDAGHTWMNAWVYVAEHPYVAVTDDSGRFSLSDVPAGSYKLLFWHEAAGEKKERARVESGKTATVDVAF